MTIRLACVKFSGERRLYVVPLQDISKFDPKAIDDFDPATEYQVKWKVEKRDDSFTEALDFPANIVLLACSPESMIDQAAKKKIKLPKAFMELHGRKAATKRSCDSDVVQMAHKSSKRAKAQVNLALTKSCQERMTGFLEQHKTDVISMSKPEKSANEVKVEVKDTAGKPNHDLESQINKTAADTGAGKRQDVETRKRGRSRKNKDRLHQESEDFDEESSVSSSDTVALMQKEIDALRMSMKKLEQDLTACKREKRKLITEVNSLRLRLKAWDDAHKSFTNLIHKEASSPSPFKTSLPHGSDKTPEPARSLLATSSSDEKVAAWLSSSDISAKISVKKDIFASQKNFSSDKMNDGGMKDVSLDQNLQPNKTPFADNDDKTFEADFLCDDVAESSKTPSLLNGTSQSKVLDKESPTRTNTPQQNSSTDKVLDTPRTSGSSDSKKEKKKRCLVKDIVVNPQLKSNEKSASELSQMILRALNNEEQLQQDDHGRYLIGNNCYVKECVWKKVQNENYKNTLMLRDLAVEVWGDKCKEYCLVGGISPKNPSAPPKEKAPVGQVHAILGVYRARMIREGMTNNEHLINSMVTAAKTLQSKLGDSGRTTK